MFWADDVVNDITKKINKDSYLVTDWKTPSGHIHVGSLRGVIVHDVVRRGLAEMGKQAVFQYGFDDFDPMDGFPVYLNESFRQYMGMPLSAIPAPDGKDSNFGQQYAQEFINVFRGLGINPVIVKTSELYKNGKFNEAIRIALDHAAEIRRIYKEVSKAERGDDWYPLQVVCPSCGKIGTTQVTGWDGENVTFECRPDLVKWAEGCGHQGTISPFDGNAKLPWKVEWAAKWYVFGSDVEGEGKDHATVGGSRDVANHIFKEVYHKNPPYDIPYEWMLVSGAKMSTSKGVGVTAKDISEILPANILRFLFVRTRYKRTLDFQPEGMTIPLLYDEYDKSLEAHYSDPESDLARAYYYAEIDPSKEPPKYVLRFSKVAYLLQMPHIDIYQHAEKEKGESLTSVEKEELENRLEVAKGWLNKFAPDEFIFSLQKETPASVANLSDEQRQFVLSLVSNLENMTDWSGQNIHTIIHDTKNQSNISPKEAFSSLYRLFIDKDSGPQVGWFLASLDKDFVIKRLKSVEG